MTIWTGKDGYNSIREFATRTARARVDEGFRRYEMRRPNADTAFYSALSAACADASVLDVGCGYGKWATLLSPDSRSYLGLDVVPDRIEHCKQMHLNAEFRLIADCGWQLGRKFDVALLVTVLQHLNLTDAIQTVKTVSKHIAHGGQIFLRESLLIDGNEDDAEKLYRKRPSHMIPKPIGELKRACSQFGWESISDDEYVLTRKTS